MSTLDRLAGTTLYSLSPVGNGLIFVSWVEASGLGLGNVMNLDTGELVTHARDGSRIHINRGTLRRVE